MRYLSKTPDSPIVAAGWTYPQHARQIRDALLQEQRQFCAYSERFIQQTDSCDVEHFDPRRKGTVADGYDNWYAVLHWMNSLKPKRIEPYLPVLMPHSADLAARIRYDGGQFIPIAAGDQEADNLIRYLGWNRPEVFEDRRKHVSRIRDLRSLFGDDGREFRAYLREHPEHLSFATALEAELGPEIAGVL